MRGMEGKLRYFCSLLFTICIFLSAPASAALFAATNPAFGSRLVDRVAVRSSSGPTIQRSELAENRLYFSVTIVGDQTTLDYLKDNEHLPLHVTYWGDDERFDTVDIGIDYEKWTELGDIWASQVSKQGVFTFRTYYRTKKIGYQHVQLTLKDVKGNTIRTVGGNKNINPRIRLERR